MSSFIAPELLTNLILTVLSYVYILSMILFSDKAEKIFKLSKKSSRKTLHVLIGNLVFILPFFNHRIFPLIVALPFIPVTFLACPYSPFQRIKSKLTILQDKTEIGHPLGLVFYSISYTVLTAFFFHVPYVVAAGILPMAYGDSAAALIGERYGKWKYKILARKSVEGSFTVFGFSFLSVALSLAFYSIFSPFPMIEMVTSSLLVAFIAMVIEALSPSGVDNLFVPLACATLMHFIWVG